MKSENGIVIIIGNNGASFFVKNSRENKSGFIEFLNDESKQKLTTIFQENSNLYIYLILDTLEQSYKKKTYPAMKMPDFQRVAKRDLASEGEKDSIKNFMIYKSDPSKSKVPKKTNVAKKIECMFISCSNSTLINNWLEFINSLNNRLYGIYALPIETSSLQKILNGFIKSSFKDSEKSDDEKKDVNLKCLISHTLCGGIRQMVFSDSGLIFTRAVNYNFSDKSFSEKYNQDLNSTFEYLKRLYVELSIDDFKVINILPEKAHAIISENKTINANYINVLPAEIAKNIGIKDSNPDFSDYLDLITASVFLGSKKILKFSNLKIKVFDGFYKILLLAKISLVFLVAISIIFFVSIFILENFSEDILKEIERENIELKKQLEEENSSLSSYKLKTADGKEIEIKEIIEIGQANELMAKYATRPWEDYEKFAQLTKSGLLIKAVSHNVDTSLKSNQDKKVQITGSLVNESGDIDSLFKKYDELNAAANKIWGEDKSIKHNLSQLPKNIDFEKKYYDFPIEITLETKK